jgi:hypothetical protein
MPSAILTTAPARHRWLSVGSSAATDSRLAGEAAARGTLGRPDPCLLIVFCSALRDPAAVVAGINSVSGGVPLIGCSAGTVITPTGPDTDSVVVVALGGSGFSVETAVATGATSRQREVGAEVAECVVKADKLSNRLLFMLTDGLTPSQDEILAGAYGVVGDGVPLVGGRASPAAGERRTFQLHGQEVVTDGVVAAAVSSDAPFGIGLRHGWRPVGDPMVVTRCVDGDLFTLDGQPALNVYLDRLGAPPEAYTDPAVFDAFSRFHPIGIRRGDQVELRHVHSTWHFQQGWLHSGGEIPERGLVSLMEGDEESVLKAAGDACRDAVEALDGRPPLGLLTFDCECRGQLLGESGRRQEVVQINEQAGGVSVTGLYTWGEIAQIRDGNGYHNWVVLVVALS